MEFDPAVRQALGAGARRRARQPVVPGGPPDAQVPLRGQRDPTGKAGAVTAFALDAKSGELTKLNQQSTVGDGPCHLVVDATGKNVLVANYGGGSVAVLPIGPDGKLAPASDFIQHKGKVFDPEAAGRPARPLDQPRQGRIASPWSPTSASTGSLSTSSTRSNGKLTPNDPPVDQGQGPLRPAPLRVPSRRQACLRDQRNQLHGHRVRLRRRSRHADRDPDDADDADRRRAPALDRRGRRPPVGQVPLRLEPRSRQPGRLSRSSRGPAG